MQKSYKKSEQKFVEFQLVLVGAHTVRAQSSSQEVEVAAGGAVAGAGAQNSVRVVMPSLRFKII